MKPLLFPTEPGLTELTLLSDLSLAEREINVAWEQYKQSTIKRFKDGLGFGRACHEWQVKYKAQGSRSGKGFEHLLEQLAIPKTTAYRWIRRYGMMRKELRANRNEVKDNTLYLPMQSPSNIRGVEKRTSFNIFLTDEQRQRFDEDVKTLGGRKKVATIFIDFVSKKASNQRAANATKKKASPCSESTKRMVVRKTVAKAVGFTEPWHLMPRR